VHSFQFRLSFFWLGMVHLRLNERESNPNPHINFITALPNHYPDSEEDAKQLLRALAAQVRPVMKAHGFTVNSFEEVSRLNDRILCYESMVMLFSTSITRYLLVATGMLVKQSVSQPAISTYRYPCPNPLELVLRRQNGSFCPTSWLMSTLCHEVRRCYRSVS
jgi:DNA-dependent metalloprotease WSS1